MAIEKSFQRTAMLWAVGAAAMIGSAGCAATVTATPAHTRVLYSYPVVEVEAAPVRIYESPRVTYHGRPAYLVGTRWYYPSGGRWVYFREEPRELRHYREQRLYARPPARATRHHEVEPRPAPPEEERRRRSYD
ncbi:MAG TPA: hypothetical protein VJU61_17020 [Polyangiaceae bacterium]|nr:hypothetical protein [Polyangiaceae bacterium]